VLLAAQVVAGLAASLWSQVSAAVAAAAAGGGRVGRSLGGLQAASGLAMTAGAPVGLILARSTSWRLGFTLIAVIVAVALVMLTARPRAVAPPARTPVQEQIRTLATPRLVGTLTVSVAVLTASNSTFSYLGPLLAPVPGPVTLETCLVLFGIAGITGTWAGGRAADRWGGERVAMLSAVTLTVATGLLPSVITITPALVVAILLWGFAGWTFLAGQQHRLVATEPAAAAIPLALHGSATQLGLATGALAGGHVVDAVGPSGLWIVAVAAGVPAVAGLALAVRWHR
jgi:predicted MFS family arabinose efflux permease